MSYLNQRLYFFATLTFGGLLFCFSVSSARTWDIFSDGSGDATTIQNGIDSALVGDTVLVESGVFHERLTFRGRDIVVASVFGSDQTILDGTNLGGAVVTFVSGESRSSVLQGFTLTGGQNGIIITNSEPSIINNIIVNNDSPLDGGGIVCGGNIQAQPQWSPKIVSNHIVDNHANNSGGGVIFYCDMIPELVDNYIANNSTSNGDGGGVYYVNFPFGGTPLFYGNIIQDNTAGDHGGGIYAGNIGNGGSIELEISHNLIWRNRALGKSSSITPNSGGGIWLWETKAWIHHNTVVENMGDGPTEAYGGGIVIDQPGSPTVEQNIIAFTTKGGGIWCGNGATPIIRNNLAWQNSGGDGVNDCPLWWQTNGNVVGNPYFCSMAGGDFTVASNSAVMTHPSGPLGAYPLPGCGPVSVQLTTWGLLKLRYSH